MQPSWELSVLDALIDSHVSFLPFIFTILLSAQTCEKKMYFLRSFSNAQKGHK